MSMNYVDKNVSYNTLIGYVDIAVNNSFGDKSGKYHKYLQDYIETLCLVSMFTDYEVKAKTMEDLVDEMLGICYSEEWKNEILPKIGTKYDVFHSYVESGIANELRPFAKMDALVDSAKKSMDLLVHILESIDVEKLREIDFSNIEKYISGVMDTVNHIDSINNEKVEVDNDDTPVH